MELRGLPDTKHAKVAELINSASRIPAILRTGNAATAAGDTGAINIWIDDNGKYRCEIMRHMITHDAQMFTNLKDVKAWARKTLPTIR